MQPTTSSGQANGHAVSEPLPEVGNADLMRDLKKAVRKILRSAKSSESARVNAIRAGTQLLLIEHKIAGGDGEKGFFS
jgi:hypothetical protein